MEEVSPLPASKKIPFLKRIIDERELFPSSSTVFSLWAFNSRRD
jgi:hypothetical protein